MGIVSRIIRVALCYILCFGLLNRGGAVYDFYESDNGIENVGSLSLDNGKVTRVDWRSWQPSKYHLSELVWLPSLSQLLAEIEKQGFIWVLDVSATNGNKVIGYAMNIATSLDWEDEEEFRSDSPEEAAASALLWILEGGTSK